MLADEKELYLGRDAGDTVLDVTAKGFSLESPYGWDLTVSDGCESRTDVVCNIPFEPVESDHDCVQIRMTFDDADGERDSDGKYECQLDCLEIDTVERPQEISSLKSVGFEFEILGISQDTELSDAIDICRGLADEGLFQYSYNDAGGYDLFLTNPDFAITVGFSPGCSYACYLCVAQHPID